MDSSTPSEELEVARIRLHAAEGEFDRAKIKALGTDTTAGLRIALVRLRAAATVLLEAVDGYMQARMRARFRAD